MKKIFSMFMTFIMALSNNLSFQQVPDKPFATAGGSAEYYYTIPEVDEPDYRRMYTDDVAVASNNYWCKDRLYSSNGTWVNYDEEDVPYNGDSGKGFWLVDGETINYSDISNQGNATINPKSASGRYYIIAPYSVQVATSSKTNDGRSITLTCVRGSSTYTIVISEIIGWWCCAGKTDLPAKHDLTKDLIGTTVSAGQVIAVADSNKSVRVTITKGGNYVSLRDFYAGEQSNTD